LRPREMAPGAEWIWVDSLTELLEVKDAGGYLDLCFEMNKERIDALSVLLPSPVIVNAVVPTLEEIGQPFVRINGWPGFLSRPLAEIALKKGEHDQRIRLLLESFSWSFKQVPDTTGMVSARILAMIINEAYYTLEENISTEAEIDTAMKLGTNYPHGPFEWARMIGLEKVHALLRRLRQTDPRYTISAALIKRLEKGGHAL